MAHGRLYLLINSGHCIICGRCVEICPQGCLHLASIGRIEADGIPELAEARAWGEGAALILEDGLCLQCGLCQRRCPARAIGFGHDEESIH
ncbi:MAG: 4Fe-4S binding protein [Candidatus Tectomicrobia bacterium]|uniref:4Fe-4S binding protein n=1 Tax=Tectimicrobiota bacterium TaxID=2528274 RepID=A0A932CRB6_UNCTE|nr:4Fe-4S binding protein [Candidatus Tectomicrobia bacterium]